MNDLQAAYERRQALFIEARTKTQQEIDRFFESIKEIPEEILAGINIPEDTSATAIVPSMYLNPPDPEKYTAELQKFKELYESIVARVDKVNAEAEECLKEYM